MKTLDPDVCYAAFIARDRRFDGWFFMGVSTTGIYCRPMCPVRKPLPRNCSFYATAAAAEQAGFRPCLRCRPELAPGHGLLDVSSRLAQAAARLIDEGFLSGRSLDALADRVGVTSRHLRRIFEAEFGVSMIDYSQTQRLLIAKRLLTDTGMSMAEVALASGFGSVRRFNDVFQARYGLNPLRLRKTTNRSGEASMRFELSYRPPFSWGGVLEFLAHRCIAGVEHVDDESYTRVITIEQAGRRLAGWLTVSHAPLRHALVVTVSASLQSGIAQVLGRVRRVFDTGCRPDLVDAHLGPLVAGLPGMRVPGAFEGFEIAVRAVVGQQISVTQARLILGRIAERFGTAVEGAPLGLQHAFPTAEAIACLAAEDLIATGIIRIRAEAIIAVAQEVAAGRIILEPLVPLDETLSALRHIRGIGEWTVQYIAMRALGWPNAFPEGDAVLKKHLGCATVAQLNEYASQWAPWRAYATVHVWRQREEAKK
ncbi:helix-turn-helix domain-containing protein [Pseudomonas cichorii]|nr:DNA-3-methyladenine glycosylase 2 family protein [Pseudomonas cichorii]MBX8509421.1 helix-turn-helix domain-containing protein [Pseudomonas cichorii]MBX8524282.1 helix-turn-helix domain-containing protein [Pseudomonas cichorii]